VSGRFRARTQHHAVEDLPNKHADAVARLADAAGLEGIIVYGRRVLANHADIPQSAADELFNLDRTVAVHDLSRVVYTFV
jgi:hypothetical protein